MSPEGGDVIQKGRGGEKANLRQRGKVCCFGKCPPKEKRVELRGNEVKGNVERETSGVSSFEGKTS